MASVSSDVEVTPARSKLTGQLVLIAGPSGAGKDTLMRLARDQLTANCRYVFPRRIVTRSSSDAEDNTEVLDTEFSAAQEAGRFALSWAAHGHRYAIPAGIEAHLAAGECVVINVSRSVIDEARRGYPHVCVALITASRENRAQRLAARGRETAEAIVLRLANEDPTIPLLACDIIIHNDGTVHEAAHTLTQWLQDLAV